MSNLYLYQCSQREASRQKTLCLGRAIPASRPATRAMSAMRYEWSATEGGESVGRTKLSQR